MSNRSPLANRLLKFWLPAAVLFFGIAWFSQLRYDPKKEAKSGLDRLNRWRSQAGVQPLRPNAELEKAAQSHARYLAKDAHGHDETNRSNPHYTGASPQERATAAGYPAPVAENLTAGNFARSGSRSTDGLMTALYHRLALLNPDHDEAGAGWARGRHAALVIEQGSSQDRAYCAQTGRHANAAYILILTCNGQRTEIPISSPPRRHTEPVKFPIGSGIDPSYDGKEVPNPLPTRQAAGNPVSIGFYGQQSPVRMHSFTLRSAKGEIPNPTILTAATDPHRILTENEFALFAPKPLDYDTEYTAEFRYSQDGRQHTERWTFHTRKKRHWLEW
jgi:periplasmic protein